MNPDDREPTERDRLYWQHRDCECGGMGLTRRWRRASGVKDHSVTFFCRCEAGRWVKARHEAGPPAAGRIPDLADYPWLWESCLTPPGARPVHNLRDIHGLSVPTGAPAAGSPAERAAPGMPAMDSLLGAFPRLAEIEGGRRRVHPAGPAVAEEGEREGRRRKSRGPGSTMPA
jgi:hypothetical protein